MAECSQCGLVYPDSGNGCWSCNPNLANNYQNNSVNGKSANEYYGEIRDDAEFIDGKYQVYMSDGVYIDADKAWW